MIPILSHLLCSALYGAIALLFYRSLIDRDHDTQVLARTPQRLVTLPLILHAWLLYRAIFVDGQIYFGVGISVSVIIWLTVLIYWLGSFFYRLEGLQPFVLAAAAVLGTAPLLLPPGRPLSHPDLPAFRVHLLISLLAYSLFTIASVQALLMAALEKRLHGGRVPGHLATLPPLLTMERLLFRIIGAGFLLLTLTLASGMLFSEDLFGQPLRFTHKIVFSLIAWLIFAALLAGRHVKGWRGRIALRWTLTGFLVLVLAYIGSKFVLEIILQR